MHDRTESEEKPVRITDTSDLWWKTAVVYCLDVETYFDSDGDGVGDFAGLAQRVDYLAELGVTCIWLMPFYPTPDRDDGYDVTDFYGVDPRLGTTGTWWSSSARHGTAACGSSRTWWSTTPRTSIRGSSRRAQSKDSPTGTTTCGGPTRRRTRPRRWCSRTRRQSIWTKDKPTGEWYLHRFYKHQPDLNVDQPQGEEPHRQGHGLLAGAGA